MNKTFAKIATTVFSAAVALSQAIEPLTTFEVGFGFRQDDLKLRSHNTFGIIDPLGPTEGSASRLKFDDLDVYTINIAGSVLLPYCFYARLDADYGWIVSQKNQSHSSNAIDVTNGLALGAEQTRQLVGVPIDASMINLDSNNRVRGKNVWDVDLGIGYPLAFMCDQLIVAPAVGFAYHRQHVRSHVTLDFMTPNAGIVDDLARNVAVEQTLFFDTSYLTSWYGPWVGLDFSYRLNECWDFYGQFEYNFARCKVKAKSKSLSEEVISVGTAIAVAADHLSFGDSKTKDAWGITAKVGTVFFFACDWYVNLNVKYEDWRTHRSHHTHVLWDSIGANINLGHSF